MLKPFSLQFFITAFFLFELKCKTRFYNCHGRILFICFQNQLNNWFLLIMGDRYTCRGRQENILLPVVSVRVFYAKKLSTPFIQGVWSAIKLTGSHKSGLLYKHGAKTYTACQNQRSRSGLTPLFCIVDIPLQKSCQPIYTRQMWQYDRVTWPFSTFLWNTE